MDSHCVHIDPSAPLKTRRALEGIIRCYQEKFPQANIFPAEFPIKVYWGMNILEADLICMRQLLKLDREWKYFLNPASTEMPLMTIEETVNVLMANGKDILEVYPIPEQDFHRFDEIPLAMR